MQKKDIWTPDSHFITMLTKWWAELDTDRGNRAILRRCATLDEVILSPAYQRFYRYMLACRAWPDDATSWKNDKLAAIAGLLAHVKAEDDKRLPARMSQLEGERPLLSELRFRNLLKMESTDDVFRGLRRSLPLIQHQANIHQLVSDIYWWNDATRKEWAYSYRWPIKQPV